MGEERVVKEMVLNFFSGTQHGVTPFMQSLRSNQIHREHVEWLWGRLGGEGKGKYCFRGRVSVLEDAVRAV